MAQNDHAWAIIILGSLKLLAPERHMAEKFVTFDFAYIVTWNAVEAAFDHCF